MNQWVSLAAIVGGVSYLLVTHGQKWNEPESDPSATATVETAI